MLHARDILIPMRFNFLGRGKRAIVAVADVGSGSAGFAILEVPKHGPSVVHAAERVMLPIEKRDAKAAMSAIASELERLGGKILGAYAATHPGARHPERLLCVIRAPWTRSQSVRETKSFAKETLIADTTIKELAKAALQDATDIAKEEFLDATVARIELNGYPTRKPAGKRARDIAITTLVSGCEGDVRAAVEHALEAVLPHTPRTLRSGSRALLSVLREYSPKQEYVIADVGGEGTTMIAVRDGAPAEQAIVAEGIYSIVRRLSSKAMPEEAFGMMRMMAREECTSPACEALMQELARIEPELVKAFGEAMAKCAALRRLPNTLFVVTHPDMASWLTAFFARIDFTQFTQTAQPFEVKALSPAEMAAWVVPARGITLDCALAVPAALVNIESASRLRG